MAQKWIGRRRVAIARICAYCFAAYRVSRGREGRFPVATGGRSYIDLVSASEQKEALPALDRVGAYGMSRAVTCS